MKKIKKKIKLSLIFDEFFFKIHKFKSLCFTQILTKYDRIACNHESLDIIPEKLKEFLLGFNHFEPIFQELKETKEERVLFFTILKEIISSKKIKCLVLFRPNKFCINVEVYIKKAKLNELESSLNNFTEVLKKSVDDLLNFLRARISKTQILEFTTAND